MLSAEQVIHDLQLSPLPHEGGYFRAVYRAPAMSGIYYLVTPRDFSALHRVRQAEAFHFYLGDSVELTELHPHGELRQCTLGGWRGPQSCFQHTVPGGVWQGTRLLPGGSWALLGCSVAPAFQEQDFELADRAALLREWPNHSSVIEALTRG